MSALIKNCKHLNNLNGEGDERAVEYSFIVQDAELCMSKSELLAVTRTHLKNVMVCEGKNISILTGK